MRAHVHHGSGARMKNGIGQMLGASYRQTYVGILPQIVNTVFGAMSEKCLTTKKKERNGIVLSDAAHTLIKVFLAAMSSSRSDIVTQSVRLFVRSFVRPLFSLSVLKSFIGVSRNS